MKKSIFEKEIKEKYGLFDFETGAGFGKTGKMSKDYTGFRTVADLNGGKDRIALYGKDVAGNIEMLFCARWQTHKILDTLDIFNTYHLILKEFKYKKPKRGVVSVAGPELNPEGTVRELTNVRDSFGNKVIISAEDLKKKTGLETSIINDFAANGFAVNQVDYSDETQIVCYANTPECKKTDKELKKTIVGPGSGLGGAGLHGNHVWQGEFGHGMYGASNDLEWNLKRFIREKFIDRGKSVHMEMIASSKGIAYITAFLMDGDLNIDKDPEKALLESIYNLECIKEARESQGASSFFRPLCRELLSENEDKLPAQAIGRAIIDLYRKGDSFFKKLDDRHFMSCLQKTYLTNKDLIDKVIEQAINIYVDAVAKSARDAVCTFGAFYGGLFISGGNARRLAFDLKEKKERFMKTFTASQDHGAKLVRTPIYLLQSRNLGLDGAAWYAFQSPRKRRKFLH